MTTRNLKTRVDVGKFVNVINGPTIHTTHCSTTSITGNTYCIMLLSVLHWANCIKFNVTECTLSKATDHKRDNVPYGASAIRHAQSQLWSQTNASKALRTGERNEINYLIPDYYYYYYYYYHLISHFSAFAGKYSPILGCCNQQD